MKTDLYVGPFTGTLLAMSGVKRAHTRNHNTYLYQFLPEQNRSAVRIEATLRELHVAVTVNCLSALTVVPIKLLRDMCT